MNQGSMVMKKISVKSFSVLITLCLLIIAQSLFAQEKQQLTVEWIYSPERRQITAMPAVYWLENGTAILYDRQKPAENRTLERFDLKNGKRKQLLSAKKALASLKKELSEKAPEHLPAPNSIEPAGQRALYEFAGDLFVLDLKKSVFRRLTNSDNTEKSARFSPDGKKLAFVRGNDLFVCQPEKNKEIRLTTDGSKTLLNGTLSWVYWEEIFGRHDIAYWWSDDSKAIAFLQTDQSPVRLMHYVDFKPQTPRVIEQFYPKAGQANPVVKVGIVSLDKRQIVWADIDPALYEYIVRVKWLPDNRRLAVLTLNRSQNEMKMFFVDKNTGKAQYVFSDTDPGWVNIHDDLYFLKNGKQFIWASERDGYNHLYRFDMNGKLVNKITSGDWALRSSGGGVAWVKKAICAIDEQKELIYFTALKKSSIERHLYRVQFDGGNLQRLTREAGTHRINFSPDARYYFDTYSSAATPPVLSLYRSDGKYMAQVAASRTEKLTDFHLQSPEFFHIPARDGFQMPASLLKPADFDPAKKYPVIVNVYGGPAAPIVNNAWSYGTYFNNILLQNGFLVFKVDNRSSSGISKTLTNLVVKQVMSDVELNDLLDAVRWLKQQNFVDSARVGIWGWSGGGMHTLLAMTRSKEFKAGIAVAPVTDWHYYDTRYSEFGMKRPQDNPDGYRKTSLVERAGNLHGHLLLVHGTYDDNVNIQNSWAFADELIKHNIMFDMMIYPMRKHGIRDNPARIHLFNKMLQFWKNNL